MWEAISNIANSVRDEGKLFIAIYNDQGWASRYWKAIKVLYNRGPMFRWLLIGVHFPYLILGRMIRTRGSARPASVVECPIGLT